MRFESLLGYGLYYNNTDSNERNNMNGKERITLLMQSVHDGEVSVKTATEIAVQIFGDVYDEGRAVVVASLNPPKRDPKKCYCGACGEGFVVYDLGGES